MLYAGMRGGWQAEVTFVFAVCAGLAYFSRQPLWKYMPLPHVGFRLVGLWTVLAGLNAGHPFGTPVELAAACALLVVVGSIQFALERWLSNRLEGKDVFTTQRYLE